MARRTDGYQPAVTLAVLVVVATLALRGYLPGIDRTPPARDTDDPAASTFVIALLVASVAIVGLAVIARLRRGSAAAAASSGRSEWMRGTRKRPTWRLLLLAFALVAAWLLAVMVLTRLGAGIAVGPPNVPPGATPTTPAPATGTAPPPQPAEPSGDSNLFGPFYVATVAFLVLLVVGTIVSARRRRAAVASTVYDDPRADVDAPDAGSDSLVRAAEVGLEKVGDLSREPRKAIIACYAAMEGELSHVPDAMPQDFDTASEVLARAVAHRALGPGSATQLVDLFDEARFSPHVMTEAHRDEAVRVLQQVLGELRSTA